MLKNKTILITTLAVSLMLTVPIALSSSTVFVNDNIVYLLPDSTGGIEVEVEVGPELIVEPAVVNGSPAFRVQLSETDTNFVPRNSTVNLQLTIPSGKEFIIYAYIYRAGTIISSDIDLDVSINGGEYSVHITAPYKNWTNKGYYSAKKVDANNVMLKIDTPSPNDYMLCEEGEAVLDISAKRAISGFTKMEFYIIYL